MNTKVYLQDSLFKRFIKRLQTLLHYMLTGHYALIWEEFKKRLYSQRVSVGLRRDLRKEFIPPEANINISIRPLQKTHDIAILKEGGIDQKFPKLVKERRELLNANIPKCYVAVTEDNIPCYIQWLIGPQHNHLIQHFFSGAFPILNKNEALLEAAFMSYSYRGKKIMPAAMSRITDEAHKLGVRWVITFVDLENIPSLKGCKRSGFSPYILKRDQWFLFQRSTTFDALTKDVLDTYQEVTGDRKEYDLKSFQVLS